MTESTTLAGRYLVTGGGAGLGAAIVSAIAAAGGEPIVLDRSVDGVEGHEAHEIDVSDTGAVTELVERLAADGGIAGVVTAAGIDTPAPLDELPAQRWEQIVRVNLFGTVSVIRAALPALREHRGRVVTIGSSLALRAFGDATAYCASKFAVLGFTRALAAETQGQVGVTCVIPAGMDTGFFAEREERYRPGPDAQLIDPAEAAETVVFALSRPAGVEVRELSVMPSTEPSWP